MLVSQSIQSTVQHARYKSSQPCSVEEQQPKGVGALPPLQVQSAGRMCLCTCCEAGVSKCVSTAAALEEIQQIAAFMMSLCQCDAVMQC